jgi:hypothetical protein
VVRAARLVDVDLECGARGYGLYLHEDFEYMEGVRVSGCEAPAWAHPDAVPHIDPASSFTGNEVDEICVGNNVRDTIVILGDVVWPAAGVPYVLDEDVEVGDGSVSSSLTLSDGVAVDSWRGLTEMAGGSLVVDGHTEGVSIQHMDLELGEGGATRIEGLTHANAGGSATPAVLLTQPGVTIRDSVFERFSYAAIVGSPPDMQGCLIRDPYSADAVGVRFTGGDSSGFVGNRFEGLDEIAEVYMDGVQDLVEDNDLSAVPDGIVEVRGTLTGSATLGPDVTYRGGATLAGDLTLEPGVRWLDGDLETSTSGSLTAIGTAADPIVFTTERPSPTSGGGRWTGMTLRGGSTLEHVEIEYAGRSTSGRTPGAVAVELRGPATVRDTTFRDVSGYCVSLVGTSAQTATVESNSYDCTLGDVY